MIVRDRLIRASREGRPLEDIHPRSAQAIVQELWNTEERSAHAYHRVDRRCGSNVSYEELSAVDREPSSPELSPEEAAASAGISGDDILAVASAVGIMRTSPSEGTAPSFPSDHTPHKTASFQLELDFGCIRARGRHSRTTSVPASQPTGPTW